MSDRTMEVLPLPRCCPTLRGLRLGTPILNKCTLQLYRQSPAVAPGRRLSAARLRRCRVPDLELSRDRRVADMETVGDPERGVFNGLFATAVPCGRGVWIRRASPPQAPAARLVPGPKHLHRLQSATISGRRFRERGFDGTLTAPFLTAPLSGVGSHGPLWPRRPQHRPTEVSCATAARPSASGNGSPRSVAAAGRLSSS